jgi:dihydroneopterin aldolase
VKIELRGIEVFGRHGVNDDERRDGQDFLVDVELEIEEPREDAIGSTVDYREVRDCVREVSDASARHLLETLAAAVADELVARFPVRSASVRVRKPGIAWAESAAVSVERSRGS